MKRAEQWCEDNEVDMNIKRMRKRKRMPGETASDTVFSDQQKARKVMFAVIDVLRQDIRDI